MTQASFAALVSVRRSIAASIRVAVGYDQLPPQRVAIGVVSNEAVRSEGDSIPSLYRLPPDCERQERFTESLTEKDQSSQGRAVLLIAAKQDAVLRLSTGNEAA